MAHTLEVCLMVLACLLVAEVNSQPIAPSYCVDARELGDRTSICNVTCRPIDCINEQLCCPTLCANNNVGRICSDPLVCPPSLPPGTSACLTSCASNANCPTGMICCVDNGCTTPQCVMPLGLPTLPTQPTQLPTTPPLVTAPPPVTGQSCLITGCAPNFACLQSGQCVPLFTTSSSARPPTSTPPPSPFPTTNNPCINFRCARDEYCTVVVLPCSQPTCPLVPICRPFFLTTTNTPPSPFPTTDNPCLNHRCGFDEFCTVVVSPCGQPPCPLVPFCRPLFPTTTTSRPRLTCASYNCIRGYVCYDLEDLCGSSRCIPQPICLPDLCLTVRCPPDRFCRRLPCRRRPCEVECMLRDSPCARVTCLQGYMCDPRTGNCIRDNRCRSVRCGRYEHCAGGVCRSDCYPLADKHTRLCRGDGTQPDSCPDDNVCLTSPGRPDSRVCCPLFSQASRTASSSVKLVYIVAVGIYVAFSGFCG